MWMDPPGLSWGRGTDAGFASDKDALVGCFLQELHSFRIRPVVRERPAPVPCCLDALQESSLGLLDLSCMRNPPHALGRVGMVDMGVRGFEQCLLCPWARGSWCCGNLSKEEQIICFNIHR